MTTRDNSRKIKPTPHQSVLSTGEDPKRRAEQTAVCVCVCVVCVVCVDSCDEKQKAVCGLSATEKSNNLPRFCEAYSMSCTEEACCPSSRQPKVTPC